MTGNQQEGVGICILLVPCRRMVSGCAVDPDGNLLDSNERSVSLWDSSFVNPPHTLASRRCSYRLQGAGNAVRFGGPHLDCPGVIGLKFANQLCSGARLGMVQVQPWRRQRA